MNFVTCSKKTAAYRSFVSGTLVLQAEKENLFSVSASAVVQFVEEVSLSHQLSDVESIEEYFLDGGVFKVQYGDQLK